MLIPIVVVRLAGADSDVARDVAAANEIWSTHCGVWFELDANVVVDRPELLILDQTDCLAEGHVVSQEEDELYDLGRGRGTDLVAYYIDGATSGALGCAAHPPDRRGFWLVASTFDFVFAHEAGHVAGDNPHVSDTDNLMFPFANSITNLPPNLDADQCDRILRDPALLSVENIVLNL